MLFSFLIYVYVYVHAWQILKCFNHFFKSILNFTVITIYSNVHPYSGIMETAARAMSNQTYLRLEVITWDPFGYPDYAAEEAAEIEQALQFERKKQFVSTHDGDSATLWMQV